VPLGTPLGITLGNALGAALGLQLGTALPIAGGGLLTVAAVSLVLGIRMVRRKQNR
jgi:predicted MFS family arabinose efflux permease